MVCKHGIEPSNCTYCNGEYDQKQEVQRIKVQHKDDVRRLKREYNALAASKDLYNWGEPWSDGDIKTVMGMEYGVKHTYELAIELGRSTKAIKMVYVVAFGKNVVHDPDNSWQTQVLKCKAELGFGDKYIHNFDHITLIPTPEKKRSLKIK